MERNEETDKQLHQTLKRLPSNGKNCHVKSLDKFEVSVTESHCFSCHM